MNGIFLPQLLDSILDLQFLALDFSNFHIIGAGMGKYLFKSALQFPVTLFQLMNMGIDRHFILLFPDTPFEHIELILSNIEPVLGFTCVYIGNEPPVRNPVPGLSSAHLVTPLRRD